MNEDTLQHFKAMKAEIAKICSMVEKCVKYCDEQSKLNEQYREIIDTQSNKIKNLEVEIQILKDGGNI